MKPLIVIMLSFFAIPALAADAGSGSKDLVDSRCNNIFVAMPDDVPGSHEDVMNMAKRGVEYAKAKNWWGLSAIVIFISMFLMKSFGLFIKIGKRWAYIIVPVLSIAAMLLSKFAGGLSWAAAAGVLTSGPTMALLSDFVKRGIMGKEAITPMKGEGNG